MKGVKLSQRVVKAAEGGRLSVAGSSMVGKMRVELFSYRSSWSTKNFLTTTLKEAFILQIRGNSGLTCISIQNPELCVFTTFSYQYMLATIAHYALWINDVTVSPEYSSCSQVYCKHL